MKQSVLRTHIEMMFHSEFEASAWNAGARTLMAILSKSQTIYTPRKKSTKKREN